MKKLKPREWFLILVPLVLMAIALMLQLRPKTSQNIRDFVNPPTSFFIESVQFMPILPVEIADGYDTKVEVILNYAGTKPTWWKKQRFGASLYQSKTRLVLRRDPKQKLLHSPTTSAPSTQGILYDTERQRYVVHILMTLSRLPRTDDDIVLKSNIALGDYNVNTSQIKPFSPVVALAFTVRRAGSVVRKPNVKPETGLKVERVLVMQLSPAQRRARLGCDTRVRVVFSRQRGGRPSVNRGLQAGYVTIKDETRREISTNAAGPMMLDAHEVSWDNLPTTRFDELYFCDYDFQFPRKKPRLLAMTNAVSLRGAWPLKYSAIIYDASRPKNFGTEAKPFSIPFTQRPAPPRL